MVSDPAESLAGPRTARWSDWAAVTSACQDLVPPFPDLALLAPAVVPSAPYLEDLDDPVARLFALTASCLLRVGHGTTKPERFAKHAELVRGSALVLAVNEARPAAWLAYSLDAWAFTAPAKAMPRPPLGWLWAPARALRDWRRASERYCGARVELGSAARNLVAGWYRLRERILLEACSREDVRRLVGRTFPPGRWDVEVALARAEGAARQAEIDRAVAGWRWVW